VAVQSTPRFAGSPTTVAPKLTSAPAGIDAGGWLVMTMPVTVEMMTTLEAAVLL
jgi:hypothetical protein